VWEDWEEHLPRKPSSCTPFLKDGLAGDDGEQSIRHHRQPNSLTVSNGGEDLFPISSHLGRASLLIKQTRGEEHGVAETAQGPAILADALGSKQERGVPLRFRARPVEPLTHPPPKAGAPPIVARGS
jgi:hypothetical protein